MATVAVMGVKHPGWRSRRGVDRYRMGRPSALTAVVEEERKPTVDADLHLFVYSSHQRPDLGVDPRVADLQVDDH